MRLVFIVIGIVLAFIIIGGVVGFAVDWGSQPKRIYGVANVRKTWAEAYSLDRAVTAQAKNVCVIAQGTDLGQTVSGSPLLVAVATYNNAAGAYSTVVSNKLEGGLVLPPDLPSKDKTLAQRLRDPDVNCPEKVIVKIPGANQ